MDTPREFPKTDRRKHPRHLAESLPRVARSVSVIPISDAEVLNVSSQGVAIRTSVPLEIGNRLSFFTNGHLPPILAEVIGREKLDGESYRVRCRCLLGRFEKV